MASPNTEKLKANRWVATFPSQHVAGLEIVESLTFTDHNTVVVNVDCLYGAIAISAGKDLHAFVELPVRLGNKSVAILEARESTYVDPQTGHRCYVAMDAGLKGYAFQVNNLAIFDHLFEPVQ